MLIENLRKRELQRYKVYKNKTCKYCGKFFDTTARKGRVCKDCHKPMGAKKGKKMVTIITKINSGEEI